MALVEKTVLIENSAAQMYALVDDVEGYTQFLPWCAKADLKYRDEHKTVATLYIDFLSVKSHFTTENAKVYPTEMTMKLIDGPFRRFDGKWTFKPLSENACKIEFRLSYEFSSKLFEKIIGPVFSRIANTFIEAFVQRAAQVYKAS
jgi:ribosome-associated toxin RatA of RatAB toxin-antitoxin module